MWWQKIETWIVGGGIVTALTSIVTIRSRIRKNRNEANQSDTEVSKGKLEINSDLVDSLQKLHSQAAKLFEEIGSVKAENISLKIELKKSQIKNQTQAEKIKKLTIDVGKFKNEINELKKLNNEK